MHWIGRCLDIYHARFTLLAVHLFIQVWKPDLSQGKIQLAAYCAEPHPPPEAMDSSMFIVPVYFIYAGVAPR
jgi:hypothetical protein